MAYHNPRYPFRRVPAFFWPVCVPSFHSADPHASATGTRRLLENAPSRFQFYFVAGDSAIRSRLVRSGCHDHERATASNGRSENGLDADAVRNGLGNPAGVFPGRHNCYRLFLLSETGRTIPKIYNLASTSRKRLSARQLGLGRPWTGKFSLAFVCGRFASPRGGRLAVQSPGFVSPVAKIAFCDKSSGLDAHRRSRSPFFHDKFGHGFAAGSHRLCK